jgi:RNA polymerase sigma-70 factor, ECF subfamily
MNFSAAGESGVQRSVESLYGKHLEELHRYVLRIGVNRSQAGDICQEAFVRLFLAMRAGQRIDRPRAWLFAVVHNTAIDAMKASLRDGPLDPGLEGSIAARGPDPEQAALEREKSERLRCAFRSLPPQQRYCMYLRAEGLRYREIAEILGIGTSAIAETVERAVKRIREALND